MKHSRTWGSRNTREQIKADSETLRGAFAKDKAALEPPLKEDGHSSGKFSAAFGKLNSMNESAGVYQKIGPLDD